MMQRGGSDEKVQLGERIAPSTGCGVYFPEYTGYLLVNTENRDAAEELL